MTEHCIYDYSIVDLTRLPTLASTVERGFGQAEDWGFLKKQVTIDQADLIGNTFTMIAFLTNLTNAPLVGKSGQLWC